MANQEELSQLIMGRKGINTHTYTSSEIQRVARVAFDLAKKRQNKVTSCEKSNVMEAGLL